MTDAGIARMDESRPEYEPFERRQRRTWLNHADRRLHRSLPRGLYGPLLTGYHGLRTAMGRNPGRGRMLPDFVIIGAAKAGTTSLYAWLSEHPFVEHATAKEIHYFSFYHYRGHDWYRGHFPRRRESQAFTAQHGRRFITGEASPSYLLHSEAPVRMARLVPHARLIVALREPVGRAYSQFQMRRRDGEEPCPSFIDAVALEDASLRDADAGIDPAPDELRGRSYLSRGRYAEQLERWFAHFPRERFHFVTIDELAAHPHQSLDAMHAFLGLPAHRSESLQPMFVSGYPPLAPADRDRLAAYFRPHNERLYKLLGRDFGWNTPPGHWVAPRAPERVS